MSIEEVVRHLAEISRRQQVITEQLTARQDLMEQQLRQAAGSSQFSEVSAHRFITKLSDLDDIDAYLHTFEVIAERERWPKESWARMLAPFLTREAQRAYFALETPKNDDYKALKKEILARMGLSNISAAQQFSQWSYDDKQPVRTQAANLSRLGRLWLLGGDPTAVQVAEKVVIEKMMRALPRRLRTLTSMRNPDSLAALVEAARSARAKKNSKGRAPRDRQPALMATESDRGGESSSANLYYDLFQQITAGGDFGRAQREDETLKHCWPQVRIIDGNERFPSPHPLPHFIVQNGLLYCVAERRGETKTLLVVPRTKRETVLELAHTHPMAGHLGAANTIKRIRDRFHWPGLDGEVKRYCQACDICQRTSPQRPPPSPLIPLPIIEVPFNRIGMDLIGPLPKSARGHEHILVILDYATRYPEAIPLRKATSSAIAKELFLLCSRVGIPAEILTDQGTPFMSRLMADLCRLLKVKQIKTSVYHPQTDGLVERFNKTLKQMLRRVVAEDGRDWDLMIPYVLFGIREVPQGSTGFTPFELLFGRQPRGLLDVARQAWEQEPAPQRSVIEHVRDMRGRIEKVMPIVKQHLTEAQRAQQRLYNRPAQPREFHPGDKVMILIPTTTSKFLASWKGPYTVVERVGPVNY
ncbi:protein NYNRIN-like [Danio rerio]|uniref:Protein NYNRIN-like n=1 Tax=Danio rerio TaxID=7955 RepID=A0AC58I5D8_DANRE